MHLKYLHYYGDESNSSILEEYGLIDKGEYMDILKPKQCTNCQEGNKPDAHFCVKCRMVLSYDAWEETIRMQEQHIDTQTRLEIMERQNRELTENIQKIMEMVQENPKLAHVKPEVLMRKKKM
jgi:hypothetical protein